MYKVDIVKDKDIGLEYECIELESNILPDDISRFYPNDWFWHWSYDAVWDYIIWNFIKIKAWDIIIKCRVPTDEQIDKSELLTYKSKIFLEKAEFLYPRGRRRIWLSYPENWQKMIFVLHSEDSALLYGKDKYDSFSYLKI